MKNKAMVLPVHDGAMFVTVPIFMNGDRLLCVFFSGERGLSRVGIFDGKPRESGPLWLFESYTRRTVPAEVCRDAHERALDALAAFDAGPSTERETSFECSVDVATIH